MAKFAQPKGNTTTMPSKSFRRGAPAMLVLLLLLAPFSLLDLARASSSTAGVQRLDRDGNGFISLREADEAFGTTSASSIMNQHDADNSGSLDATEFDAAMGAFQQVIAPGRTLQAQVPSPSRVPSPSSNSSSSSPSSSRRGTTMEMLPFFVLVGLIALLVLYQNVKLCSIRNSDDPDAEWLKKVRHKARWARIHHASIIARE